MAGNLSLFPSRVRIVNPDGTMTAEFYRALDILFQRVGGPLGNFGGEELSISAPASEMVSTSQGQEMAMQPAQLSAGYEAPMLAQPASVGFMSEMNFQTASSGGAIVTVAVGASPFVLPSVKEGSVSVQGGTVSAITLTRGGTAVTLGFTSGLIPVIEGDRVTTTYTVAPTINFIPR